MEFFHNIELGIGAAFTLSNLVYCFFGVLIGTAIGVLPGLGPLATIAMLLPVTFALEPVTALIMLAGIYYGAQYGGSTTAILVNLPGESSSVVTCLDGYQMARQGRAGQALAVAALGSFFAGTVATLVIAGFAPVLAEVAFYFGPVEYFALMVLGLTAATILAHGSFIKAVGMVIIGLILGLVGPDVTTGSFRFTFGSIELMDGIEFVAVAMGLFAFTDIIVNLNQKEERGIVAPRVRDMWLSLKDLREAAPAAIRGTAVGSLLGLLPGGGAMLSSFASYSIEKRISRTPEKFGKGAIEGLAGPESANNAGAQTSFIPMLTLGIPSNGVMALMIGAMMIHDITPGPHVMIANPTVFWGLVVSMWVGNLMLVVLNLPLIPLWVKMLSVRYSILYPAILVICCIGLYSIDNRVFPIYTAAIFAAAGCLFYRLRCEAAPLLLGFILGPMMEEHLRRALLISDGDPSVFVARPMSAIMLLAAVGLSIVVILPQFRKTREQAFAAEE